jgi:Nuclease-related domain
MDNQPADLHADPGARRRARARAGQRALSDAGRRARARALLADLIFPAGVVAIGVLVLVLDGHELSWLAGLIAGGGAGAWVALHRGGRPARRRVGGPDPELRAEQRTAAALEPLQSTGWRFLHDVRGFDTTFDHIAIGHGGVIVLQSMSPDGVVSIRDGEAILERTPSSGAPPRLERLRPRALTDASAVRHDVARLTGRRLWVQAVVVIWSDFPAGCVVDGRCVFIHGSRLAGWLARRPHQLDPGETDDVAAAVTALVQCGGELPLPLAV